MKEFLDIEINQRDERECLNRMYQYIREKTSVEPKLGIVLGSGLNNCLNDILIKYSFEFCDIPYFPKSTIQEHKGRLCIGIIGGQNIVIVQGRVHYYEGYTMTEVVRPIRLLKMLGVKTLILTNSAGAINQSLNVGDIVAINNHIASFVPNPLRGKNVELMGPRFPDMSDIYNDGLVKLAHEIGKKVGIQVKDGVYLQTSGPCFESAAEIRMYKVLGADLVGMSTACESIAAIHAGMKVTAISIVSNMACGLSERKLSMEEVIVNSGKREQIYKDFFIQYINEILREIESENEVL